MAAIAETSKRARTVRLNGEVWRDPGLSLMVGRYTIIVKDEHGALKDVSFAYTQRGAINKMYRRLNKVASQYS